MKKVLFVFWHGLGDNILATPAIKKYKQTTGNYVGWMMMEKVKSAMIFEEYPYIDSMHYCSDAWHCCGRENLADGSLHVIKEAEVIKKRFGYDEVVVVNHRSSKKHKVYRTADEMGVKIDDSEVKTEYFYDEESPRFEKWCSRYEIPDNFVFFHGKTSESSKDLPLKFVKDYMDSNNIRLPIVSPDFTWNVSDVPLAFSAHLLKRASHIIVSDSVIYHLAHALDLNVDLAYFKRGEKTWNIVHPLHSNREKVIYSL